MLASRAVRAAINPSVKVRSVKLSQRSVSSTALGAEGEGITWVERWAIMGWRGARGRKPVVDVT